MKVLKPGRWLFKFKCANCDAELEGEECDLFTFQMERTITVACNCGACGARHRMQNNEIPEDVLKRLHNPSPRPK